MSDEEAPPPPERREPTDSVPPDPDNPHASRDSRRRRLEGVIPEIVRRAVELGVEKAQVAPDNLKSFVGDMKLPKEIGHYVFQQIDETKNGLFRVVAKELRDFLEQTNFAGEMQKLLTTVQFEVNTTIRFTPNDGRKPSKKSDPGEPDDSGDKDDEDSARDADDASEDEDDSSEVGAAPQGGERRPTPLPKPEVKTAVHVRRDDRERRRRRDRAT